MALDQRAALRAPILARAKIITTDAAEPACPSRFALHSAPVPERDERGKHRAYKCQHPAGDRHDSPRNIAEIGMLALDRHPKTEEGMCVLECIETCAYLPAPRRVPIMYHVSVAACAVALSNSDFAHTDFASM